MQASKLLFSEKPISTRKSSIARFEGRHKPIFGGLTVAVLATDTLKQTMDIGGFPNVLVMSAE